MKKPISIREIDSEKWTAFKSACYGQGKTVQAVILELIEKYIREVKK